MGLQCRPTVCCYVGLLQFRLLCLYNSSIAHARWLGVVTRLMWQLQRVTTPSRRACAIELWSRLNSTRCYNIFRLPSAQRRLLVYSNCSRSSSGRLGRLSLYAFLSPFYPRDAMQRVCLSVRLSDTRQYCVKTKKASVMISSPSGSSTIIVFWCQISSQNSKGVTPSGNVKQGRGG